MKLNINPFSRSNPMSWQDAAIVAAVSALAIWILDFLASATLGQIREDPAAFAFEAFKTYLVSWAGNFISLVGLKTLVEHREGEKPEHG